MLLPFNSGKRSRNNHTPHHYQQGYFYPPMTAMLLSSSLLIKNHRIVYFWANYALVDFSVGIA
jgi:hypothetical protein